MTYREQVNNALTAASVAEEQGFVNTAASLREIAQILAKAYSDRTGEDLVDIPQSNAPKDTTVCFY